MKKLVAAALAATLAACEGAPLPMAPADADAAGKAFSPPSAGLAALYVYRARSGNTATVTVGSRLIGYLQGANWTRVDLPAGSADVQCSLPAWGTVTSEIVELRAGEIVYLSAVERISNLSCNLAVEPASNAQPAILAGKRVRELQ